MANKDGSMIWGVFAFVFLFGGMWYGKQNGMKEYENKVKLNTERILEQFPNQDEAFFELTKNYGVLTEQDHIKLRDWVTSKVIADRKKEKLWWEKMKREREKEKKRSIKEDVVGSSYETKIEGNTIKHVFLENGKKSIGRMVGSCLNKNGRLLEKKFMLEKKINLEFSKLNQTEI